MAEKNKNSDSNSVDVANDLAGDLPEDSPSNGSVPPETDSKIDEVENGDEQQLDPENQILELENQNKAMHEQLLRTAAELENVRKRARRDVEDAKTFGRTEVLRDILPVIDSLDLALNSVDPDGSAGAIVEGVVMVRKQFLNATERYNLKPIETGEATFDPNFHEAVAQVASEELETGRVVEEVRKGYLLGDRLLRAAMVVVSKGSEMPMSPAPEPASEEEPEPEIDDSVEDEPLIVAGGEDE